MSLGVEKMSGIYIPGAKIPDGDYVRVLMLHKDGTCVDGIGNVFKVIPVPPHGRLIVEDDAIETAWMILAGIGYRREENPQLGQTVREVYATAPTIEVE